MTFRTIFKCTAAFFLAAIMAFAQPKPKSQKEVDAIMAIQNATDPAGRIAAVEDLLTKFADTEFKSFALMVAAASAQQMNDFEKMVVYAERTLEADPKNFQAMLMLAGGIAQRTREHDLDREEKLGRVEKLANQAIEIAKAAPKPNPQLTDEQWEAARKDVIAQGYEALGQAAMVRKKYDVAVQNWKAAVDTAATPDPATMVRLANAYNQMAKPDEALAVLDKLNTMPDVHPQIKAAATEQRNNAVKLKSGTGAAKPATTPAPGATPPPAPTPVPSPAPAPAK
jgi:tetratricopeptide (TPR) repeat protein